MKQITSTLKQSLKLLREYKFNIAIPIMVDMLFLFIYGFVFSLIFNKIGFYLAELYNLVIKSPEQVQNSLLSQGLLSALRSTPELASVFNKAVIWFVLLAAAVYLIYSVFHGLSWAISHRIIGKKIAFLRFSTQFFLINLFWFVFYVIQEVIAYLFELRDMISINVNQTPASNLSLILWLYLVILAYFALISYTLIGKYKPLKIIANSFKLGFKKIKILFPSYLIVLLVFLIINFILVLCSRINLIFMFIVGIITVFPAMTWARVFFNLTVQKLVK